MFCKDCEKREQCKNVCKKVENYLRKNNIYSANWIRPLMPSNIRGDGKGRSREINFSSLGFNPSEIILPD